MAMTFLQIVKRFCRECGAGQVTTTVSQSGEALRMVDWVNSAYMDVLGAHQDWGFLRTSTSFASVAGQAAYTPTQAGATNFGRWVRDSVRNYPTATGTTAEVFMEFMDYESWRNIYQFGSNRTATSQPYHVTITPEKALGFGPVPAAGYTITGDYFTAPVEMSGDSATHLIPAHYEMIIVYKAMMFYGGFEAASETYDRGRIEFNRMMSKMRNDYLPDIEFAEPLL